MKSLDADGVLSDRSECQDSKINQAGGSAAFFDDGQTEKPTASESVTTSKVETSLAGGAADCSLNNILPSRSGLNEDVAVSHGARTSTEKSISGTAEETEHQSCSPERTVPSEPYAPQKTQILAVQSVSRNDSTEDIVSNVEIDVGSPSMEVDKESGAEQTVNGRIVDGTKPSHESSQEKNSDTLHLTGSEKKGGESKWTGGEIQTDNTVEAEPMPDDSDTETTSIRSLSGTAPQECNISKDIQDSASKLLVTLASETVADKIVPIKEKESGDVRSKFFSSSKPVPKLHHPSTEGVAVSSSGSKGIYAMQSSHPEIGKRQRLPAIDAHLGRKLVGDSKSPFRELSKGEPALLGIEKNVKTLCNISDSVPYNLIRESINCDGVQNGCKAVVTPIPPVDKEVPKGNPAGLGSKMNTKDLHNFGCGIIHAGLTDKTTKSNTQTSEKCRIVVSSIASMRNSKIISAEVLKDVKKTPDLSSLKISKSMGSMRNSTIISAEGLKAVKKTPDLYSLKISKSMGENKRPNAIREREISFSRNSEKNMEVNRNNASKIILPVVNAEKKSPLITSLKRKTIEAVNADLVLSNPPKRLSLSPRENRNFKECSESIVEDQVCDNGDRAGSKTSTVFYDHCSGLQRTQELNIKDIDISSAMENDGNVKMAEAFAKELEDPSMEKFHFYGLEGQLNNVFTLDFSLSGSIFTISGGFIGVDSFPSGLFIQLLDSKTGETLSVS
ncbi:unnamed protein product [Dovyalis caffra]|uniref:Uncharacterized protein n=1 Tax=Dovyalis caffra TaxID=77055 RepID=A0AAV1SG65_9ROSI|nr:unnamed protein product [Dovyalis caffra]